MKQRTVVITGANSGIGKETAVALAAAGDRVIIACRNAAKAAEAREEIARRSRSEAVETASLDLASFASIRACAADLAERCSEIDVLINNAGLMVTRRSTTADGFETSFGVNHLGHFLFTGLLADLVKAAETPRVINLASLAHNFAVGGLKWDDLQAVGHFNGWSAYGRAKLANIYFTQELAKRWRANGVCVSCLHPGTVNSGFGRDGDTHGWSDRLIGFAPLVSIPPDRGADTSVWLAIAPTGADLDRSGTYWVKRRPGRLAPWARRPADAARLWEISESLVDSISGVAPRWTTGS